MKASKFTVTIHMVSSVDGFIAKNDNSVSWFETSSDYEDGVVGQDPEAFLKTIDCYVMGSRTYEHAVELSTSYGWAYGDKPTIVLTKREWSTDMPNIEFYAGDLGELINNRLRQEYNSVWVVGGAAVVKDILRRRLANEIRVSILPIILGEGLAFFDHVGKEQPLRLKDSLAYRNGMVELCYEVPG